MMRRERVVVVVRRRARCVSVAAGICQVVRRGKGPATGVPRKESMSMSAMSVTSSSGRAAYPLECVY